MFVLILQIELIYLDRKQIHTKYSK